jgi:hypothetical protein
MEMLYEKGKLGPKRADEHHHMTIDTVRRKDRQKNSPSSYKFRNTSFLSWQDFASEFDELMQRRYATRLVYQDNLLKIKYSVHCCTTAWNQLKRCAQFSNSVCSKLNDALL